MLRKATVTSIPNHLPMIALVKHETPTNPAHRNNSTMSKLNRSHELRPKRCTTHTVCSQRELIWGIIEWNKEAEFTKSLLFKSNQSNERLNTRYKTRDLDDMKKGNASRHNVCATLRSNHCLRLGSNCQTDGSTVLFAATRAGFSDPSFHTGRDCRLARRQ